MPKKTTVFPTAKTINQTLDAYENVVLQNGPRVEGEKFLTDTLHNNEVFQRFQRGAGIGLLMGGPEKIPATLESVSVVAFQMGVYVGLAAAGARDADAPLNTEVLIRDEEPIAA